MPVCIRCFVSGRVQGVFYRASTQAQANSLCITGYARNLPDRRVEVLACGDESAVEQLKQWLSDGPQYAEVTSVSCEKLELKQFPTDFVTS